MSFNLAEYVISRGVDYVEVGPNVKRNHVNICCPFCGPDDPSHHMGINRETGQWGCWRDVGHRGQRPHRLLRKLFQLSWQAIQQLLEDGAVLLSTDALLERLNSIGSKYTAPPLEPVEYPREFKPLTSVVGQTTTSYLLNGMSQFLARRGFSAEDAAAVAEQYELQYALGGYWNSRIIFPIRYEGELVAWTGRAVGPSERRYVSHPKGHVVKNLLYGYDDMEGGRALIIVEGPLDRLKVDFYAQDLGVRAVGLLGVALTEPQVGKLLEVASRFDETWILLDDDALQVALLVAKRIAMVGPKVLRLPEGIHDPGEMTKQEVQHFVREHLR